MESNPHAFRPEDLLAHREWVERAARALVYGDADADDLQQQAWLKVLARPPQEEPRSPRGWLWSVLRSVAFDRGRAARSRRLHEEAAARPERLDASPAELVARAELLTRVARMALELEEPYRATVLLRYFEDLEPAAIAALQGVPVETVRTRLKRAVAQLRERMDAENGGDRRRWALALVPLLRRPAPVAAAAGAGAAAATAAGLLGGALVIKKAAAALAILALLLLGGRMAQDAWFDADETSTATSPGSSAAPAVAAVPTPGKEPVPGEGATPVSATEPAPAAAPTTGSVLVSVRWHDGTPAAGVGVRLTAETRRDDPRNARHARTGDEGTALFPGLPVGTAWVKTDRDSNRGDRAKVVAGTEPTPITFTLAEGFAVEGVVVDREGRPVAGATVWLGLGGPLGAGTAAAETAGDGTFRLRDMCSPCEIGARAPGHAPSVTAMPSGAPGSVQRLKLALRGPGAVVSGRVVDPEGAPVAGALVQVGPADIKMEFDETSLVGYQLRGVVVESDADGRFRVDGVRPGEIPVQARREGFGPWSGTLSAPQGGAVDAEIRLGPGATLSGSVLGPDSAPILDGLVTVRDETGAFYRWAVVAKDGSYRIPDLPTGEFTVEARSEALGRASERIAFEAGTAREWSPRLIPRGVLTVRLVDGDGAPLSGWSVTATAMDATRAEHLYGRGASTGPDGLCEFRDAPDRTMKVDVLGPGADRRVLQLTSWSQAGARPGPGTWEIRVPAERSPTAFLAGRVLDAEGKPLVSGRIDVAPAGHSPGFCDVHPAPADGGFRIGPIPPGAYALRLVVPDLPPLPLGAFRVGAGETADVGTVRLEKSALLSLRILSAREPRPAIVRVRLYDAKGMAVEIRSLPVKDGMVAFGAVLPGEYSVNVSESAPSASSGRIDLRVAPGGETVAEVILRSGRHHYVQVDLPEGNDSVWGARVTVKNADGTVVLEEHATSWGRREPDGSHTREPGLKCLVTLPPGRWTVEVLGAGGERGTGTAVIPEKEPQPSTTTIAIR